MRIRNILLLFLTAAILAGGLTACRDEEQGRPLSYEKGVYGGPPQQALSDDQRRSLQQRGQYQGL